LVDNVAVFGVQYMSCSCTASLHAAPKTAKGAPGCRLCAQLLEDHHARELLMLYDAARMVCEGLDALRCVVMNVKRPDLSFNPPDLADRMLLFCSRVHHVIAALITAALEVLRHVKPF
jgi:hypothetical protein